MDEFIKNIKVVFAKYGWTSVDGGSAILKKNYDSAVGQKTALLYYNFDKEYDYINPEMLGEGRNCLASVGCFKRSSNKESLIVALDKYARQIDDLANGSYAIKLHRNKQSALTI